MDREEILNYIENDATATKVRQIAMILAKTASPQQIEVLGKYFTKKVDFEFKESEKPKAKEEPEEPEPETFQYNPDEFPQ